MYNEDRIQGGERMYGVIPEPYEFSVKGDEAVFILTDSVNIDFCKEARAALSDFSLFLKNVMGIESLGGSAETVRLIMDSSVEKEEGYKIEITKDLCFIKAFDEKGALYAVQTLKQLLIQSEGKLFETEIYDFPRFKWRGFMLDTARYFFSVEAVKLFIDAMVLHKLNRLHLHLTDDQGWRVEIYGKLLLAQVGGFRAYTNFGRTPHGGFYTKEDIEEIVNYALDRFIEVIPEIDQPGHAVSMIAAYPFLSCFDRELTVSTHSGVHYDVLCIGKESTFEFMQEVLDEICEMFPSKIIHLGGDEVPTERWKHCPHCQKRIRELGLSDEKELHTYYLNRMGRYLKSKGFEVIVWNDTDKDSKLDTDFIWQYWKGITDEDRVRLSKKGIRFINSSNDAYYLDLPYGHISLKECYEKEIFFEGTNEAFMGAEACLWAEYVPTMKKAGYCTFPRLGAFSERVWSDESKKDYGKFENKLSSYYKIIETLPFDYAKEKQAMPSFFRKWGYNLYFERRKLHWNGLGNIIENRKVRKEAKEKKDD